MKKIYKNLLVFTLLFGGLLVFKSVFAQGLGLNAVNNGLAGSLSSTDPRELIGRIINIVLGFLGIIAVGLIIYAGFIWMTSDGDEEKVTKAKNILKNAVIGLGIILASWGIATFIISSLSGAVNSTGGDNGGDGNNGCVGLGCVDNPPCTGPDCKTPPPDCDLSIDPNCEPAPSHPVITGISPLGGFCTNDNNKSCNTDIDCPTAACDLISPNGAADNFITIFGKNFETYSAASSSLIFVGSGAPIPGILPNNLNSSCVNFWSDTQIIIAIPNGVTTGPIKVVNKDDFSDLTNDTYGPKIPNFLANNIVRPGLCDLSPDNGNISSAIGYSGINLYSGAAYFGNYQSNVPALQSSFNNPTGFVGTSTIPNIKSGLSGSFVQTEINGVPQKSNYLLFTKKSEPGEGPYISSFTPLDGNSGQYVTIYGSGFGNSRGSSQVYFGDKEASYDFPVICLNSVWTDKRIIVKVPESLTNGAQIISIKLENGDINTQTLNPNSFQFDDTAALKTSLCKIDPITGPAGTPVTLWGEYFGNIKSEGFVKFNYDHGNQNATGNATGTITQDGQANLINTTVPDGSITGPVKVIKNSEWGNDLNFNIGSCTANSDCGGTQVCCPQNTHKGGRCSNTISECLINIPTSVFEWSFNTGYGTSTPPDATPDPCAVFSADGSCTINPSCCINAMATGGVNKCTTGTQIASSSPDAGYCAYFSCSTSEPTTCASTAPVKSGDYKTLDACVTDCPVKSPCTTFTDLNTCQTKTNCCFDKKFDSSAASGTPCVIGKQVIGGALQDEGYCAYFDCQLPPPLSNEKLCAALTPVASGTYLGIDACTIGCAGDLNVPVCGCTQTSDCGVVSPLNQIACGSDTCCNDRPKIITTSPVHLADKVCRNTLIKVDFDQKMNTASFNNNVLLLEERIYGNGVCPVGTFAVIGKDLAEIFDQKNKNWWQNLTDKLLLKLAKLTNSFSGSALADTPDPNKLYCSTPGMVYSENNGDKTSLYFSPKSLLDSSANYYLIVKGDENLDNNSGVVSSKAIGFNGPGYFDPISHVYVAGGSITFNSNKYKSSQIIKFTTLSAQSPMAGICAIDHVSVDPVSYLFNTTDNALKSSEDDSDATKKSFDTIRDSDKVFTASAYSVDDQVLRPVTGYFWNWNFTLNNSSIATLSNVANLPVNRVFVTANKGVSDGSTKVKATVNMSNFSGPANANCSCSDTTCSNHCPNAYTGGDGFNSAADLYVFICNNPWPAINTINGTWFPWFDQSQGLNSSSYNYKFYYCRDNGEVGTLDDLPAINSQPLTIGTSTSLVCSNDHSPCASADNACGPINSDGGQDGICIWGILKESYFLRSPILAAAIISGTNDQKTGGVIRIDWQSDSSQVYSYKIYYLSTGKGSIQSQEFKASSVCQNNGTTNICSKVITDLINNTPYVFQISVISSDRTESALSPAVIAIATDQTPPVVPAGLQATVVATTTIKFNWTSSTNDTSFFRLYHGVMPGKYGEYFDSAPATTTLSLPTSQFSAGNNYFSLFALDSYNNKSAATAELHCIMSINPLSTVWTTLSCS